MIDRYIGLSISVIVTRNGIITSSAISDIVICRTRRGLDKPKSGSRMIDRDIRLSIPIKINDIFFINSKLGKIRLKNRVNNTETSSCIDNPPPPRAGRK